MLSHLSQLGNNIQPESFSTSLGTTEVFSKTVLFFSQQPLKISCTVKVKPMKEKTLTLSSSPNWLVVVQIQESGASAPWNSVGDDDKYYWYHPPWYLKMSNTHRDEDQLSATLLRHWQTDLVQIFELIIFKNLSVQTPSHSANFFLSPG